MHISQNLGAAIFHHRAVIAAMETVSHHRGMTGSDHRPVAPGCVDAHHGGGRQGYRAWPRGAAHLSSPVEEIVAAGDRVAR